MAAPSENAGSGGRHGGFAQGAGPLGHNVSGVTPLDESLATHLLAQAAGWAEGRRPLPPLPRDREALEYLDKIFRLGAQLAAAANNMG